MNLDTLRDNLKNTIAGKERLYQSYCSDKDYASMAELCVINAKLEFIQINIDELKKILADVELCINHAAANSWAGCVDRQSGAFDESEMPVWR